MRRASAGIYTLSLCKILIKSIKRLSRYSCGHADGGQMDTQPDSGHFKIPHGGQWGIINSRSCPWSPQLRILKPFAKNCRKYRINNVWHRWMQTDVDGHGQTTQTHIWVMRNHIKSRCPPCLKGRGDIIMATCICCHISEKNGLILLIFDTVIRCHRFADACKI